MAVSNPRRAAEVRLYTSEGDQLPARVLLHKEQDVENPTRFDLQGRVLALLNGLDQQLLVLPPTVAKREGQSAELLTSSFEGVAGEQVLSATESSKARVLQSIPDLAIQCWHESRYEE